MSKSKHRKSSTQIAIKLKQQKEATMKLKNPHKRPFKLMPAQCFLILTFLAVITSQQDIAILNDYLATGEFRKPIKYLERYFLHTYTKIRLPGNQRAICYAPIEPKLDKKLLSPEQENESPLQKFLNVTSGLCTVKSAQDFKYEFTLCSNKAFVFQNVDKNLTKKFVGIFDDYYQEIGNPEALEGQDSNSSLVEDTVLEVTAEEVVKRFKFGLKIKNEVNFFSGLDDEAGGDSSGSRTVYLYQDYALIDNPDLIKLYNADSHNILRIGTVKERKVLEADIDLVWNHGLIKLRKPIEVKGLGGENGVQAVRASSLEIIQRQVPISGPRTDKFSKSRFLNLGQSLNLDQGAFISIVVRLPFSNSQLNNAVKTGFRVLSLFRERLIDLIFRLKSLPFCFLLHFL